MVCNDASKDCTVADINLTGYSENVTGDTKLLFLFGCAKYIRIKMSFIWPMHVLEFRSSVPLCTLVYKRVLVDVGSLCVRSSRQ